MNDADLDRLLDADRPEPSPGFDARFRRRLRAPRRRRRVAVVALAALAAALVLWLRRPVEPVVPPDDAPMIAHLELLEHYGELEVLEALEDPETFELVAKLDELEEAPR